MLPGSNRQIWLVDAYVDVEAAEYEQLEGEFPKGYQQTAQTHLVGLCLRHCQASCLAAIESVDRVGDGIVAKHASRSRSCACCRATYAVDYKRWLGGFDQHGASHVVDLVIRVSGRLRSPSVGRRIIFKRMHKIAAWQVGRAAAHGIKLPIGWEKDAHGADPGRRKIRAGTPACW